VWRKYKKLSVLSGALGLAILAGGFALASQFQTRINQGTNGSMTLIWDSKVGTNYAVYWAPNLSNPVALWQLLGTVTASNTTSSAIDSGDALRPPPTNSSSRFYSIAEMRPSTVSSDILTNTIWNAGGSPYLVSSSIHVRTGVSLTILGGTRVLFASGASLTVDGVLKTLGTSNQPVTFTSWKSFPQRGDWQGLVFTGSSSNNVCVLSNVVVQYAQVGISCSGTSPQMVNSTIQYCSQQGIYLTRSSPLIQGCTIQQNSSQGIYVYDTSSPQILGNQIVANGSYGIYLYGTYASGHNCMPVIQGNTLDRNGSYAVYAYYYYQPGQTVIDARSNWWGTADPAVIAARVYDYTDNSTYSPVVNFGNWLGLQNGTAVGGKYVSGQIMSSTVWQTSDSPIGVIGPLLVSSNATLTIQPGVDVEFFGNYALQVDGALQALGTALSPITFTSSDEFPLSGDWQGLVFTAASSNNVCVLSNVVVEYAQVGVNCTATSPQMVNSTIQYCSQQGIYLTRSSPLIQGCLIQQNSSYGIYCYDTSSPQILGSQILANGSYGISLNGTAVSGHNCLATIQGNTLGGNGSYAVYAYNYYQAGQVVVDARSNWWGTADASVISGLVYDCNDNPSWSPVVNFGNWLGSQGGAAVPSLAVSGQVLSNTVWQVSDSPVAVVGSLLVTSNVTLTIQPGVQVNVFGNYMLQVDGTLQALGTSNQPVTFTSWKSFPQRGDWQGLVFTAGSSNNPCVLSNVVVQYAQVGVNCTATSPQIVNSTIQYCSQQGVYLTRSSPLIQGCTIQQNTSYGIYCYDASSPQILSSQVLSNGSYGIRLDGTAASGHNCLPLIQGNRLQGNTTYALYSYNYYQASQVVLDARSNWWGTAVVLLIPPTIYDYQDSSTSPWVDWGNWVGSDGGSATSGRSVLGTIASNTVWRAADSPIGVIGSVVIPSNVVVSVEAGTQIKAFGNYQLSVAGTLSALGQPTNQIVFGSGQIPPKAGDWQGIKFTGSGANASVLSNVVVEYAQTGILCSASASAIVNSHIQRQSGSGIHLDTSSPTISSNLIEFNATGIFCYQSSSPLIQGNTVALNSNDGVRLQSSTTTQDLNPRPVLYNNSIFTNSTAGAGWYNLATASYYQPGTTTINAISNWWGSTDPSSIEQTIYHYPDNSGSPHVDYSQYLSGNPNFTPFGVKHSVFWSSPNGDAVLDTMTIKGFISHTSQWTTVIMDSNGGAVRSYSGTGVVVSNVWDGSLQSGGQAPEGLYRSVVLATNLSDNRNVATYGDLSYSQRTPPLTAGGLNVLPDGTIANQLIVQGTVGGAFYTGYIVDYGVGSSPTSFITITTNSSAITGNVLASLDSRGLTNGTYTFRLRTFDYAGNVGVTQWVAQVDNIIISEPDGAPVFFNPATGSTTISFGLSRASAVTVKISPVNVSADYLGNLSVSVSPVVLRTFSQTMGSGTNNIIWDGRDSLANMVTNGTYAYSIYAQSDYGRTNSYAPPYTAGPVTFTNAVVGTNINFQGNDPVAISYALYAPAYVSLGAYPQSYSFLAGAPRDAGPNTDYWNGRSPLDHTLVSGSFTVYLYTLALPENGLVVQTAPMIASLKTESYVITPSYSEVSQILYGLQRQADVALWLRDPNGNRITLLQENGKPAGNYVLEWNGHFDAASIVSVAGDYEVHLDATDTTRGTTQSLIGNLTIRR
jgi:parallel beta-helix repeat protein